MSRSVYRRSQVQFSKKNYEQNLFKKLNAILLVYNSQIAFLINL